MKTIILHIGHFKTGSTSLQDALARNVDRLARQGVFYPGTGLFLGGHHNLAYALHNRQRYTLPEAPEVYLSALAAEVAAAPQERVVLSSEHFALYDPEPLLALFPGCRKQIVLYVRRQDHLLDSLYRELVKNTQYQGSIEAFCRDVLEQSPLPTFNGPVVVDYQAILERWTRHAGVEEVIVRPYETGVPAGGVVRDFLELLGLTGWPDAETGNDLNRKHPAELIALRRAVDPVLPPDLRRGLRDLLWQVTQAVHFPDRGPLLDGTQRRLLVETCAAANAAVARRYLGRPDGRLFAEAEPPAFTVADRRDPLALTADDVAKVLTTLLIQQGQQLRQLQRQVADLEARLPGQGPA